jgi:sugar fermentation stimulation protein A
MYKKELRISLGWKKLKVGEFLRRLNRFMVEVAVNNEKVLAHLPNSGRLTTVLAPKAKVFLKEIPFARAEKRKSQYDVFAIKTHVVTIVDTRFSSFLAEKAIENGLFKALKSYSVERRNFRVEDSILDLKLKGKNNVFFVEVKSVTHVVNGIALFPDAPTQRGAKHVQLLTRLKRRGHNAGILFSIQRGDVKILKPNHKLDPKFSLLLEEAVKTGVKVFVQTSIFQPPDVIKIFANTPRFEL